MEQSRSFRRSWIKRGILAAASMSVGLLAWAADAPKSDPNQLGGVNLRGKTSFAPTTDDEPFSTVMKRMVEQKAGIMQKQMALL